MSKRKLLLADDSVTIQKVVNLTFADEDIEIISTGDADETMRRFVEVQPDLVMIDVHISGLSGYDICEMIKQDDATNHIPVILLVGSFEQFDEAKASQVKADDFLTKPFPSIRQLVDKVSNLLDLKDSDDNSPGSIAENVSAAEPLDNLKDFFDSEVEERYDTADASIENLGEFVGADDETIQTFQKVQLPKKTAFKFESKPIIDNQQPVYESFTENDKGNSSKPIDEIESETNETADSAEEKYRKEKTIVESRNAETALNAEKIDSLESSQSKTAFFEEEANDNIEHSPAGTEYLISAGHFPPEIIEAIAERVAEKLSGKVIKNIVRETIEQLERKK